MATAVAASLARMLDAEHLAAAPTAASSRGFVSTLNPQPSTLNTQPSVLSTQHSTLNTQP